MLSNIYTRSYVRTITKQLRDKITYIPDKGVTVGFQSLYKKNTNGTYTKRQDPILPSIACYIFANQDGFIGLGRWATPERRGVRRFPLFVIEIWARNIMERDQIASFVEQTMFESIRYFQTKGIRRIELLESQPKQYDPTDKIVMNVSHVMTQVQRWVLTYRLTINHIWHTEEDGLGTIQRVDFEDSTYGTWSTGGGFIDPLINNILQIWEDNMNIGL